MLILGPAISRCPGRLRPRSRRCSAASCAACAGCFARVSRWQQADSRAPDALSAAQADSLNLLRDNRPYAILIKRQAAYLEGFSLHAGVHLHANGREGLAHLCGYGACPAFITEKKVVREILEHLGPPTTGSPIAPARIVAAGEHAPWQDDVPELRQNAALTSSPAPIP